MLTMLHRADGGPRLVNLDLALYVDELQDGGSSIMFGGGEWVTVSEAVAEIMTLDADDRATAQAPALVEWTTDCRPFAATASVIQIIGPNEEPGDMKSIISLSDDIVLQSDLPPEELIARWKTALGLAVQ